MIRESGLDLMVEKIVENDEFILINFKTASEYIEKKIMFGLKGNETRIRISKITNSFQPIIITMFYDDNTIIKYNFDCSKRDINDVMVRFVHKLFLYLMIDLKIMINRNFKFSDDKPFIISALKLDKYCNSISDLNVINSELNNMNYLDCDIKREFFICGVFFGNNSFNELREFFTLYYCKKLVLFKKELFHDEEKDKKTYRQLYKLESYI